MTSKSKSKAEGDTRRAIAVVGPKSGFRRCGIQFGAEPVILTEDDITEEQVAILVAEPRLVVAPVEIPVEAED